MMRKRGDSNTDTFDMFADRERGRFGDAETAPKGPRVTGASDLVDVELQLRQDRPDSLMVTALGAAADVKWISLPKSQIEFRINGAVVIVTLPEWLAKDKGLI